MLVFVNVGGVDAEEGVWEEAPCWESWVGEIKVDDEEGEEREEDAVTEVIET